MKSLSDITENVNRSLTASSPSTAVGLPSRPAALLPEEITKIQSAIDKHFIVKKEETYGYVPVMQDGVAIRQEFDVVGEVTNYKPRGAVPAVLWEAMLRPAPRNHVIYHLGRLAAHRRDTRGGDAFQVVMEDIAGDIGDVSEWAVIMACAEMRQKNSVWFPSTAEITSVIKKYAIMLDNLYLKRIQAPVATASSPGQSSSRSSAMREEDSDGGKQRRETIIKFLRDHGDEKDYSNDRLYSNYNLEMTARRHGWAGWVPNGAE